LSFEKVSEEDFLIKTISHSSDNSVILLAKIPCKAKDPVQTIVPDCKTFLRLISNIDSDHFQLNFDKNYIEYKNSSFDFKYHLLDESYFSTKKSISEEKINNIEFETKFVLSKQKFAELLKFNTIIPDAEKLYFYTKDSKVYAKIGDEQKINTNQISLEISNDFKGEELKETIPLNIQNLILFSFAEDVMKVSVNRLLKVFKFETSHTTYIVSGLVK
jgi:hypothetical protein